MYLLLINVVYLCKTGAQTYGIKYGSRAEYLIFGKSCVLQEGVGQDINGVGNENVDCVRCYLNNLLGYLLYDSYIGLNKLKP